MITLKFLSGNVSLRHINLILKHCVIHSKKKKTEQGMIKSYTLHDLGMNVYGEKFVLPFDIEEKDETILQKTVNLISEAKIYERLLFTDRCKDDKITVNEWNNIETKCLYEGYDDKYPFTLVMEVFRYMKNKQPRQVSSYSFHDQYLVKKEPKMYCGDEEIQDGQWMVAVHFEQGAGELLHELIDLNTMPAIIKKLNLKKYTYK